MSGMNPTVVGALIAGGAALVGFAAAAWNTRNTLRANRQVARDQRLWDKKTELYEAVYALIANVTGASTAEELQKSRIDLREHQTAMHLYAATDVAVRYAEFRAAVRTAALAAPRFQAQRIERLKSVDGPAEALSRALRADLQGTPELAVGGAIRRLARSFWSRPILHLRRASWERRDRRYQASEASSLSADD